MNHKHFYCFLNPPLAVGPRHVPSRPAAAPMPPPCHHLLRGHRVGCAIAGRVGSPRALTRSGTGLLLNPSCGVAAASDYKVGIDDDDFEALAHRMQVGTRVSKKNSLDFLQPIFLIPTYDGGKPS